MAFNFNRQGQVPPVEKPQEQPEEQVAKNADVTFRVDADCYLLCDGENIEPRLTAGKTTKIQLPLGVHLLEFVSVENPEIRMEREVEYKECKNHIELIQGMQAKLQDNSLKDMPPMPAKNAFLDQLNAMSQQTMNMQMPPMPAMPNVPVPPQMPNIPVSNNNNNNNN